MNIKQMKVSLAAAVLAYSLSGCGFLNTTPTPAPVQLRLIAPVNGLTLKPDEIISVQGEYSGTAVAEVHLWVNGTSDSILEVRPGDPTLALDWLPKTTGRQILYLEAYDQAKAVLARSDAVVLMVEEPAATPAPEPTAPPEPTAEPMASPVAMAAVVTTAITGAITTTEALTTTIAGPTTATVTAPAAAASTASLTVTIDSVNLRSGPGTDYALQGQLSQGQTATVIGKSADGTWWQIRVDSKPAWVFGELVQASASAAGVAVVQAPPAPTAAATVESAATAPVETAAPVAIIEFTPVAPATTPVDVAPAVQTPAPPAQEACNESHPFWAGKLNNNPDYAFCTPVPFEFVPGASADPDELVIRWHIFGIQSLELRIDPSGDGCGIGSTGLRQQVQFKEDNFRLNRRSFPPGGYKVGLWATLYGGAVQDWGELHFCGKG